MPRTRKTGALQARGNVGVDAGERGDGHGEQAAGDPAGRHAEQLRDEPAGGADRESDGDARRHDARSSRPSRGRQLPSQPASRRVASLEILRLARRSRAAGRARRPRRRRCPGARPIFASSTSRRPSARGVLHAVDREEQVEGAVGPGEADAVGAGERRRRRCRGPRRARVDLQADEVLAVLERGDRAALHEGGDAGGRILDQVLDHRRRAPAARAIQPMRQPVIAQFLEKVLTKRMRSSSLGDVVEGRRALARHRRSGCRPRRR